MPTKRNPPLWAQPHDGRHGHLQFSAGVAFSRRLATAIDLAGITPSELARRIWGDQEPAANGTVSAKGRDRISKYLSGARLPDARTLELIAKALRVPAVDLAPEVVGKRLGDEHPEIRMTVLSGQPDQVHFTFHSVIGVEFALKLVALIRKEDRRAPSTKELVEHRVRNQKEADVRLLAKAVKADRPPVD